MADLFVALIHCPVLDRNGRIVTSAITSLDIHDIARSSRTFGVRAFFVVHPIAAQREFAASLIEHWRIGYGRKFDGRRVEALDRVEIVAELDDAIASATRLAGARPLLVHTSARSEDGLDSSELRARLEADGGPPLMAMLGTGFGMAPAMRERADLAMAPIRGVDNYNHLSVRAAASIILDRLRGR